MATTGTSFFSRRSRWVARTRRTSLSSSSSLAILRRMCRRSDSSWVSPGPRVPMAPSWRSRCFHIPVSRGSRYLYWARATWSRPSLVRARLAKMSRIRAERSITVTPSSSVSTRCWEGERGLSKITISAPRRSTSSLTSAALPSPMKVRGSGADLFCRTIPRQVPPAVSSRAASSSRDSSVAFSSRLRPGALRPTRTARLISLISVFSNIWGKLPRFFCPLGAISAGKALSWVFGPYIFPDHGGQRAFRGRGRSAWPAPPAEHPMSVETPPCPQSIW